jgi:hypothetical protein
MHVEVLVVGIPIILILLKMMPTKSIVATFSLSSFSLVVLLLAKHMILLFWVLPTTMDNDYEKYLYKGEIKLYIFNTSLIYPISNFYLKNLIEKRKNTDFIKIKSALEKKEKHLRELQECNDEVDLNQCARVGARLMKEGRKKEGADYMAKTCLSSNNDLYGGACGKASRVLFRVGEKKRSLTLSTHGCFKLSYGSACYWGGQTSKSDKEKLGFFLKGCELEDCFSCSEAAEIYVNNGEYLESVPFAEKSCLGERKKSCEAYSRYNILKESDDKDKRLLEKEN